MKWPSKKFWVLTLVLLAFCYFFAQRMAAIDFTEVFRLLKNCDPLLASSYLLLFNLASLCYGRRVALLVEGFRRLSFTVYFHMDNLACALGYAVPGLGEVFRLLYLKNSYAIPYAITVTAVALERLFFVGACIMLLPLLPRGVSGTVQLNVLLGTLGVVLTLLVALKLRRVFFMRMLTGLLTKLRLLRFLGLSGMVHFSDVVSHVLRPRIFLGSVALTAGQCTLLGLKAYVLFLALGYKIDPVACVAAYVAVYLIIVVPSTPGRFGVYEAACLSLYNGLLEVPVNVVLAFLVLDRVLGIMSMLTQSGYSLWRLKLSFAELVHMHRSRKPLQENP